VFLIGFVLLELLSFAVATRGFGPESFSFQRVECSSLVGVNGAGLLSLRATSHLPGGFYAELYDRHPEPLSVVEGDPHLLTWWSAGETVSLAYVVSPTLRGVFGVGPTVVVAHDPLGFAFKSVPLNTPWTIESIVQPRSLALGHPTRLASTVVGQTSLSARGSGTDFRTLREYEPHDEFRRTAWTRSGQGTLYVRDYERESQQDLLVLLDVGQGMAAGIGYDTALEKAIEAAAEVLRLNFDEGGRGGVVVFSRGVASFVPAGRGSSHEFRAFRELTAASLGPAPSSLAGALAYVRPRLERPTTLFAFSALDEDLATLTSEAARLRPGGHRLYALIPEAGRMYSELAEPNDASAFELLIEPDRRRVRAAGMALESAGAVVGYFGRDDAIDAVAQLFARRGGSIRSA
jgi:uncharacterized protein (DUF58 family)